MISHKHKFLSIRIPKTGSTSVTTILKPYFDIEGEDIGSREGNTYYHHRTTKYMKSHFEKMEWNFDDYFKFARSIQFQIKGTAAADFEINDITLVYKEKRLK